MALLLIGPISHDTDLIIFDKDGTLILFSPVWQNIYLAAIGTLIDQIENPALVLAELHATLGFDPIHSHFSTHGPFATAANATIATIVAAVLYRHAQPPRSWDETVALVQRTFVDSLSTPPDPALLATPADLPTLFAALQSHGVRIAVITSDERNATLHALDALGVAALADVVIASDDPYPKKPAPQAVWAACKQLGVSVERTVMVGDSLTDMRMGKAAGVGLCVGVLTGPASQEDLAALPDVIIDSIAEIRLEYKQDE